MEVCRKASIDLLYIDKTKLDDSFLDAQFHIEGYQYNTPPPPPSPHLGEIVTKMLGEK